MVFASFQHRAKNDLMNPLIAGCISGGILASRGKEAAPLFSCKTVLFLTHINQSAGVGATVMGCGGFAAFSVGIDWLMAGHH